MECVPDSEKMIVDENSPSQNAEEKQTSLFKKPILIGKIGRFPRKIVEAQPPAASSSSEPPSEPQNNQETAANNVTKSSIAPTEENIPKINTENSPAEPTNDKHLPLPYKEPSWSGFPSKDVVEDYKLEVLKSGVVIEIINLMQQPFWVFGRSVSCDMVMAHPTISRYHAVLQYKAVHSEDRPAGFYIYDLGSTHGTFLNKNRLKPRMYVRVQVGHMVKLGFSSRTYLLAGPSDDDADAQSEMSITELKQQRVEKLRKREEARVKAEQERVERVKKEEERGVDWGMAEDADEETDLAENPYAQTNNEELYLDDPKKALRGFMEREGFEYEYDVNEQGMGQFLCKVVLPLDDARGRPLVAEALVKGKKKEAVVQCALEACRILDRHGILRQANHESRKRKSKNWEEDDFYDSDDDTFLDRTGTVEKKREKRMKEKVSQQPETYQSLLEKEKDLSEKISTLEKQLVDTADSKSSAASKADEEDSLESFMKELKQNKPDKHTISKIRTELALLKQEHVKIVKLVNIAKPAHLPELVPQVTDVNAQPGTSGVQGKSKLPLFGKRLKLKVQIPARKQDAQHSVEQQNKAEEDDEEDDEEGQEEQEVGEEGAQTKTVKDEEETESKNVAEKFEKLIAEPQCAPFSERHQQKLSKIINQLQKLADKEDRMHVDWKLLSAKKHKVMEQIIGLSAEDPDPKIEHKISSELNRILQELETMTAHKYKVIDKVKKMGTDISLISAEIKEMTEQIKNFNNQETEDCAEASPDSAARTQNADAEPDEEESEKRKKKNLRRIQQRQEKAEAERLRGYQTDTSREDYNMWVPPVDQLGDGRTNLNDKFGY